MKIEPFQSFLGHPPKWWDGTRSVSGSCPPCVQLCPPLRGRGLSCPYSLVMLVTCGHRGKIGLIGLAWDQAGPGGTTMDPPSSTRGTQHRCQIHARTRTDMSSPTCSPLDLTRSRFMAATAAGGTPPSSSQGAGGCVEGVWRVCCCSCWCKVC